MKTLNERKMEIKAGYTKDQLNEILANPVSGDWDTLESWINESNEDLQADPTNTIEFQVSQLLTEEEVLND